MEAIHKVGFLVPLCDVALHSGALQVEVEERPRPQDRGRAEQPTKQGAREATHHHILGCFT